MYRPFTNDWHNALKILMETGILGAFIAFALLMNDDSDEFYAEVVTWVVVAILGAIIGLFGLYVLICGIFGNIGTIAGGFKWVV